MDWRALLLPNCSTRFFLRTSFWEIDVFALGMQSRMKVTEVSKSCIVSRKPFPEQIFLLIQMKTACMSIERFWTKGLSGLGYKQHEVEARECYFVVRLPSLWISKFLESWKKCDWRKVWLTRNELVGERYREEKDLNWKLYKSYRRRRREMIQSELSMKCEGWIRWDFYPGKLIDWFDRFDLMNWILK